MWALLAVAIALGVAVRWARARLQDAAAPLARFAGQRVLLVTAHPDDECMFFAPVVRALVRAGASVALLCCSRGNAAGQGAVRAAELGRAAAVLGLAPVTVLEDPQLQDGPQHAWSGGAVAAALERVGHGAPFRAVLSFDAQGVSGHPNHAAVAAACRAYCAHRRLPLLELESSRPKYVGPLALVLEAVKQWCAARMARGARRGTEDALRRVFAVAVLAPRDYWRRGVRSMLRHRSQMVWFRWLYILFSRHMHVSVVRIWD